MSRRLEVPDGLQVVAVADADGPMIEFYTGRWQVRYSRSEVMELIGALQHWLNETHPPITEEFSGE
jgi:hypothetical protein